MTLQERLDQLKQQRDDLLRQAQSQLDQLTGAITVLEQMLAEQEQAGGQ